MTQIEEIIREVPDWQGKQVSSTPLSGGLTNSNFKVEVDGQPYFVRVPGESTALLSVNRQNEYFNAMAAHSAGVGPRVVYYVPNYGSMVLEFLSARTMSKESLNESGQNIRMAESIRRLHAGPRFMQDFDMFRLTDYYLVLCHERQIPTPEGYLDRLTTVQRIEQAMRVKPLETVPCHNDLLAENYMDDGQQLWLIDYEYSGNNDPTFELGNTCQEMEFNDEQIAEVCATYFGEATPALLARMKLNMIMSDVGWGLWAAIQQKISTIEFDFWGWALERWGRAEQKMDSSEFESWLRDVQQ